MVLLTTQYLEESDRLAERTAIIDQGKVIADGTRSELKTSMGMNVLRIRLRDPVQCLQTKHQLEEKLGYPFQTQPDPGILAANTGIDMCNDISLIFLDRLKTMLIWRPAAIIS